MDNQSNIALSIQSVCKSYGDQKVLKNIDIEVKDKEFLILLGPSGCGKTTLLKIIAGLLPHNSGSIILKGKDITNLPTYHRDIGMVFQNYALFPHMTVFQNVAFGLRMRRVPKEEIRGRVENALKLVRLEGLGNRSIKNLSGGQQQRVALARALVLKPSLLLMDEPLSNLDAKLRAIVRVEIAQIQRQLGVTAILVTHDQTEAMTMGDRIILMQDGVVKQSAQPHIIYEQPNDVFVASFIGSPQINLFSASVSNGEVKLEGIQEKFSARKFNDLLCSDIRKESIPEGRYIVGVRPENMTPGTSDGVNLEGQIIFLENLGADQNLHVKIGEMDAVINTPAQIGTTYSEGDTIHLSFAPGSVHLFDAETQKRVSY